MSHLFDNLKAQPRTTVKKFAEALKARIARAADSFLDSKFKDGLRYAIGIVEAALSDYDVRDPEDILRQLGNGNEETAAKMLASLASLAGGSSRACVTIDNTPADAHQELTVGIEDQKAPVYNIIYKYPLHDASRGARLHNLLFPKNAAHKYLHVAVQDGVVTLWVEHSWNIDHDVSVDLQFGPKAAFTVYVVPTGSLFFSVPNTEHIGTVLVDRFVWHVYASMK